MQLEEELNFLGKWKMTSILFRFFFCLYLDKRILDTINIKGHGELSIELNHMQLWYFGVHGELSDKIDIEFCCQLKTSDLES